MSLCHSKFSYVLLGWGGGGGEGGARTKVLQQSNRLSGIL